MPVDFYKTDCNNVQSNCDNESVKCLQITKSKIFGISDIDGGNNIPAKINIINPNLDTDFIIINDTGKEIYFKAIDWCVPIFRNSSYNLDDDERNIEEFSSDDRGTEPIKRCEGFIEYEEAIIFIEIKNRPNGRGGWIKDSREKFEETILSFKEHHPNFINKLKKPILCNPSFSKVHQNETIQKRILKDKIGLDYKRENSLSI